MKNEKSASRQFYQMTEILQTVYTWVEKLREELLSNPDKNRKKEIALELKKVRELIDSFQDNIDEMKKSFEK